jgi:hypothetical protein
VLLTEPSFLVLKIEPVFEESGETGEPQLPKGEVYAVGVPDDEGGRSAYYLKNLTHDPSGADLATAWVALTEPAPYHLG